MKTLRALFYLLLAANLVLAVFAFGPLLGWQGPASQGEPERIARQYQPEKIRLLAETAAPTGAGLRVEKSAFASMPTADSLPVASMQMASGPMASAPAAASLPVSRPGLAALASAPVVASAPAAPVAAAPRPALQQSMPMASAPLARLPATPVCLAYAGLAPEQAAVLVRTAKTATERIGVREINGPPGEKAAIAYWVAIPARGGRAGAIRRAAELRAMGVEDFFVVQEAGPQQYAISLGLFRSEAAAQRHLENIRRKGVTTARVIARENSEANTRVELTAAADVIERFTSGLPERLRTLTPAHCQSAT